MGISAKPTLVGVWRMNDAREYTLVGRDAVLLSENRDRSIKATTRGMTSYGRAVLVAVRSLSRLPGGKTISVVYAYSSSLAIRFTSSCEDMTPQQVSELDALVAAKFIASSKHFEMNLLSDAGSIKEICGYERPQPTAKPAYPYRSGGGGGEEFEQ